MRPTTTPKYYIKGNLSEKQIEADVAAFMGWCTPPESDSPFRLLDVDEQATGADKLFDRGMLLYLQFKKSSGLRPITAVAPTKRKDRSKVEDVRIYRAERKLADDPSLFFQLHARAKTAGDFQHNVLLRYELQPFSRGINVAPLLLDKEAYHRTLFDSSNRFLLDPFYYRHDYPLHTKRWIHQLQAVPFLREHVSISPHEAVDDHNHFYAYSETGTDVSWHSPSLIEVGPTRLSDFLATTFRTALSNPESMGPIETLSENVSQLASTLGFVSDSMARNNLPMTSLQQHGEWLLRAFGIRQFLLLGSSERIAEARR